MTKAKLAVGALVVAGFGTAFVLQHQAQERLREESASLRAQLASLQETQALADLVAATPTSSAAGQTQAEFQELLRLRGEVGALRKQQKDLDKLMAENRQLRASQQAPPASKQQPIDQDYFARESLAFAGYANPEAAFQSSVWGLTRGDLQTALAGYSPELRAQLQQRVLAGHTDEQNAAQLKREFEGITGFRILKKEAVSEDETWLTVLNEGKNMTKVLVFRRFDSEWKIAGDRPAPRAEAGAESL